MNEYEFELIFRLQEGENPERYLDALFEAGCDDATIGTGRGGMIGLHFTRLAPTAKDAVQSAISDVVAAIPHARLDSAGPDLVNASELAILFGCTRQNMSKYTAGKMASVRSSFPKPVISGKTSYWHAALVGAWLRENDALSVSDALLETLYTVWSLNQAHEQLLQPNPQLTEEFTRLLARVA